VGCKQDILHYIAGSVWDETATSLPLARPSWPLSWGNSTMDGEDPKIGIDKVVSDLFREPLKRLREFLASEEGKSACLEALAKACPPPTNYVVFAVLKTLIVACDTFGPNLVGEATQTGLLRLIDRVPVVERLIRALTKCLGRFQDATKLKQALLDEIRQSSEKPHGIEVSHATSTSILEALAVDIQFSRVRHDLESEFDELSRLVELEFQRLNEPRLEWPELETNRRGVINSLHYTASQDEFVGREDELEYLHGFLASDFYLPNQFRWVVLTGRAGDGKSRLASELVRQAQPSWRAGRLIQKQFMKLDPAVWAPLRPTLIVIDYATHWPEQVHALLHGFAVHSRTYKHPLRVLLIAREISDDWFKRVVTPSGDGLVIKNYVHDNNWCPNGELRLKPISKDLLIGLMRARFDRHKREAPPNEILFEAAERLDARFEEVGGHLVREPPRPLFAAAAAEALLGAAGGEHATSIAVWQDILAGMERERTLSWLIDRDRNYFWRIQEERRTHEEDDRLALHENALTVTTMTLGHLSQSRPILPPSAISLRLATVITVLTRNDFTA
jgi:hypothetical protein